MSRSFARGAVAVSLFFTAACSQDPAAVNLRGQNTYGRSATQYASSHSHSKPAPRSYASSSYSAPVPVAVSSATTQSASVESIGVSDLPPPAKTAQAKQPEPTAAPKKVAAKQNINPWTGKPREEFSEVKKVKSEPVRLSVDQPSFIWPVNGSKVISGYGPKGGGKANDGINIAAAQGEPVWAAADGEVVYAGNELAGYGNMVLIKHSGGKTTTYAHLSRFTVDKYDRIQQGDIIGYVGATGNVKQPQLHFAVRDGKDAVDPMKYVSRSVAGL